MFVNYKDLPVSPDNWTAPDHVCRVRVMSTITSDKWRGAGAICRVSLEVLSALIKTGKMRFNCAGYYRPHETPGTRSTVSSYWRNTININIIQMDGLIREINILGKRKIFATRSQNVSDKDKRGGNLGSICILHQPPLNLMTQG